MGLDRNEQLSGALTLHLGGYNALVDSLVATRQVGPGWGRIIKLMLRAYAVVGDDDKGRVAVPLKFAKGEIYLGPLSLDEIGRFVRPD